MAILTMKFALLVIPMYGALGLRRVDPPTNPFLMNEVQQECKCTSMANAGKDAIVYLAKNQKSPNEAWKRDDFAFDFNHSLSLLYRSFNNCHNKKMCWCFTTVILMKKIKTDTRVFMVPS